ncbi:hypothetical protein VP01_166g4 [Puccinia sorghi]|uniref:Uncharacterized protein n=1 Tax=Puccinia sorghi TaxID=27349 RepID=A0A0L6VGP3_9BASI|nr:hypothetical protein VP01_166g4 [Puccinia sorghi]
MLVSKRAGISVGSVNRNDPVRPSAREFFFSWREGKLGTDVIILCIIRGFYWTLGNGELMTITRCCTPSGRIKSPIASNHRAQIVNRTLGKSRALLDSDVMFLSQPQRNLRCLSHLSISLIYIHTFIYVLGKARRSGRRPVGRRRREHTIMLMQAGLDSGSKQELLQQGEESSEHGRNGAADSMVIHRISPYFLYRYGKYGEVFPRRPLSLPSYCPSVPLNSHGSMRNVIIQYSCKKTISCSRIWPGDISRLAVQDCIRAYILGNFNSSHDKVTIGRDGVLEPFHLSVRGIFPEEGARHEACRNDSGDFSGLTQGYVPVTMHRGIFYKRIVYCVSLKLTRSRIKRGKQRLLTALVPLQVANVMSQAPFCSGLSQVPVGPENAYWMSHCYTQSTLESCSCLLSLTLANHSTLQEKILKSSLSHFDLSLFPDCIIWFQRLPHLCLLFVICR